MASFLGVATMFNHKFRHAVRRFVRDRSGNFMMMFGLGVGVIFLAAGIAVDYSMALAGKTRVNNALDAATLATARALSVGEINPDNAEDYLERIFAANIGTAVDDLEDSPYLLYDVIINEATGAVTASARYEHDLKLLQVATGRSDIQVASKSEVQFGSSDIEVAMVLDVTGSMNWNDAAGNHKLTALKTAAKSAVEKLLNNANGAVKISLVPYAESVNVGPNLAKYVYADYKESKSDAPTYNSALFNETGVGYDYETFQEQYLREFCGWEWIRWRRRWRRVWRCSTGLPEDFRVENDGTNVDLCATDRKAPKTSGRTNYQYSNADPVIGGMISRDSRLRESDCIDEQIVPLTSNKTTLDNAINAMSHNGGTAGHIGLQWAWYTISHNWRNFLPVSSQPGDHSVDPDLDKYIIFMTDGVFNTAYADNTGNEGWTGDNPAYSESPDHTTALCTAIKAQDIKVFVVAFDMDESVADGNNRLERSWIRNAQTLLGNCATPNSTNVTYFYKADDADALTLAFENIARTIRNLRLTL